MEALARTVSMSPPKIPVAWNLTGGALPAGAAPDALYWRRHMREPVRFADGIKTLHGDGYRKFLEVGPHPTLIALAQQSLPEQWHSSAHIASSWQRRLERAAHQPRPTFMSMASRLTGRESIVPMRGVGVALPTYPFERERYWAAPRAADRSGRAAIRWHGGSALMRGSRPMVFFTKSNGSRRCDARQHLPAPSRLNETAGERFNAFASEHGLSIYDRLMPELDRLSIAYIQDAFTAIGIRCHAGPSVERCGRGLTASGLRSGTSGSLHGC